MMSGVQVDTSCDKFDERRSLGERRNLYMTIIMLTFKYQGDCVAEYMLIALGFTYPLWQSEEQHRVLTEASSKRYDRGLETLEGFHMKGACGMLRTGHCTTC